MKRLGRSLYGAGLTGLAFAPTLLLAAHLSGPRMRALLAVGALICALFGILGCLPGRARRIAAPLLTIAAAGLSAYFSAGWGAASLVAVLLNAGLALALSLTCASGPPFALLAAGLAAYVVCGIASGGEALAPIRSALFGLACAYVAGFLFFANDSNLAMQSAARGQRPARGMFLGNRVLCALFLLIGFAVSQIDRIREAVERAWKGILRFIAWLIALLTPDAEEALEEGIAGGMPGVGMAASEPAPFWLFLEKVMYVLVALAAVAALIWLLKKVPGWFRKLRDKLRALLGRYMNQLGADYEDETESISDWAELKEAAMRRTRAALKRMRARKPWGEMDNRERVRSVYARLSKRSGAPDTRTARETLESESVSIGGADRTALADSYDRARYSVHPVADQEAENARKAL